MIRKGILEANLLVLLIQKSSEFFSKKNFKSRIEYLEYMTDKLS